MKLIVIVLTVALTSCTTAYQTVSISSQIVTGNDPAGHAASWATDSDCRSLNLLKGLYCDSQQDPARTYNRNGL